ncbi:uncharacterized protein MICPUCDRAFT_7651, partial [Micromonas pusilla CCMP1545]
KDNVKRNYWYRAAADRGDSEAVYSIGTWYYSGDGVKRNRSTACEWFKNASELGHGLATGELARCYVNGHGVRRNEKKAIELHTKAAGQVRGLSRGPLRLRLRLLRRLRDGVAVNKTEALKWYRLA